MRMKTFLLLALSAFSFFTASAQKDPLQKFTDSAKASHKNILVQFSGSDWCIPCIKMEKAIYTQKSFQQFADSSLITVHADFPRSIKLPKQIQKQNEFLAEKYNKQGAFPMTVLLDEFGKVLKVWNGYKDMSAETFVSEIRSATKNAGTPHS